MGKTRNLFKKIRDIKETFHVRMGMIKGRNSKDLTEAEQIKHEYTEEPYKKGLNDPDNHDGVCDQSLRARHAGRKSQVGLRKHHYEQSQWR